MPGKPHIEKHFTASETVRDIVIGMSDGLTVPFALAAGLTGAIAQSRLIVTAGFAEIAAGSIAMGLGGYLAARGDAEHYARFGVATGSCRSGWNSGRAARVACTIVLNTPASRTARGSSPG